MGGGVWTSDNHKGESMNNSIAALLISVSAFAASPALAGSISFKPLIDTRMRYENVDQDGILDKADALTIRARAGFALGQIGSASCRDRVGPYVSISVVAV